MTAHDITFYPQRHSGAGQSGGRCGAWKASASEDRRSEQLRLQAPFHRLGHGGEDRGGRQAILCPAEGVRPGRHTKSLFLILEHPMLVSGYRVSRIGGQVLLLMQLMTGTELVAEEIRR